MNLPQLPADKANHFVYGAALGALGGLHSVAAGAAVCTAFAIGKEWRDYITKRGNPEAMDALATLAGGAVALLPLAVWRVGGGL